MIEHKFDPVTIPSCKSADIFIQAQRTFRPEFLFIPRKIAGDFLITDIQIGKDTQMLGTGCIPAAIFSTSAVPELLSGFKLVKAAETMRLSITNQSADPRTFSGTLRSSTDKQKTDPASKKYFLGYGSTNVAARSSALISVQPRLDFQPFRLIVPSTIAPKFKIMEMSIRSRNLERGESLFKQLNLPWPSDHWPWESPFTSAELRRMTLMMKGSA